jgi:hypothetical protein
MARANGTSVNDVFSYREMEKSRTFGGNLLLMVWTSKAGSSLRQTLTSKNIHLSWECSGLPCTAIPSLTVQQYAAAGYVVLYTNPREVQVMRTEFWQLDS